MKNIFLVALLCGFFSTTLAQPGKSEKNEKKGNILELKEELGLSDKQVGTIKEINSATRAQLKANRENFKNDKEILKSKQREIRKNHREKVLSTLDETQKQKLRQLRKEHRPNSKKQRSGQKPTEKEDIEDVFIED